MKRRWRALLALLILAAFAVWLEPTRVVWGWLRGEAFYQGRPTSYWAEQIRPWQSFQAVGRGAPCGIIVTHTYVPNRGPWIDWLAGSVLRSKPAWPAVLDGDPAAVPVLTELLKHGNELVRDWAAVGLERLQTGESGPTVTRTHALDETPWRVPGGPAFGAFR